MLRRVVSISMACGFVWFLVRLRAKQQTEGGRGFAAAEICPPRGSWRKCKQARLVTAGCVKVAGGAWSRWDLGSTGTDRVEDRDRDDSQCACSRAVERCLLL